MQKIEGKQKLKIEDALERGIHLALCTFQFFNKKNITNIGNRV